MKSLYESILSKSRVGRIKLIQDWLSCHSSLSSFNWTKPDDIENYVTIRNDHTIDVTSPLIWFFLDTNEQVPSDLIKFNRATSFGISWNGTIEDWSFLPDKMQGLFLTNHRTFGATVVTGLKLDLNKIQLDDSKPFEINSTKIDIQDIEIKCGKNKKVKLNIPARRFVNIKCDATDVLLEDISSNEFARFAQLDTKNCVMNMDHFFPKKNYPNLEYIALATKGSDVMYDKDLKKWRLV